MIRGFIIFYSAPNAFCGDGINEDDKQGNQVCSDKICLHNCIGKTWSGYTRNLSEDGTIILQQAIKKSGVLL